MAVVVRLLIAVIIVVIFLIRFLVVVSFVFVAWILHLPIIRWTTNCLVAPCPSQTVNVSLQRETMLTWKLRSAYQVSHYWNQTICIEGGIMLLRKSKWSSFPIRHLLAFADFKWKHFFGYFCQTSLLTSYTDFAVVSLGIDEIAHVLVKIHPG